MRIPDGLPVRGYRAWSVVDAGQGGWFLSSLTRGPTWSLHEPARAVCSPRSEWSYLGQHPQSTHSAPDAACRCGLHGISFTGAPALQEAARLITHAGMCSSMRALVLGLAEGFGKVVITERGWRAERARPVALFRPIRHSFLTDERAQELAERYGVPLI